MKKIIPTLIAACLFLTSLSGVIIEVPNLDLFEKAIQSSDQNSLVLFDVDGTLIESKDLIFRSSAIERSLQCYNEIFENPDVAPPGKHEKEYFLGQILSQIGYEVVNPKIVTLIESLQRQNIKTIAFTRLDTGPCGPIQALEDWRIEHLRKLGMDFKPAFPDLQEIRWDHLTLKGKVPLYKEGVLYANKQGKGAILLAFLEAAKWMPSQVFFIDDRLEYLESVEEALKGTGVDFVGFHYTEATDRPCIIDEQLVKFQMIHLAKTGRWLSDDEARKVIDKPNECSLKAVVFDCGGVVVQANQEQMTAFVSETLHLDSEEAKTALELGHEDYRKGGDPELYWVNYAAKRSIILPSNFYQKLLKAWVGSFEFIPRIIEIVNDLKTNGFQIAMLSNIEQDNVFLVGKKEVYNYFDPVILSCDINVKKPEIKAYQILLTKLDLQPEACLFIDNAIQNVIAARSIGIDSIHFLDVDQLKAELAKRGCFMESCKDVD